jgi:N-acetylglucosamine-6-phosphate deacetylase
LAQIVKSATETPARIMGVDGSKGSLREGFDADIVIFDNDVNVSEVIVGGKLIVASFIQDCLFAS